MGVQKKENTENPNEESTERSVAQEEIPKNKITIFEEIKSWFVYIYERV